MLALQLRFSALPTHGKAYSYAQYAASTTQPLPFAPKALAYRFPAQEVTPKFGQEIHSPSLATDSSALRAEAARLSGYRSQKSTKDGFLQFWNSVSDELEQAWHSIRIMFR